MLTPVRVGYPHICDKGILRQAQQRNLFDEVLSICALYDLTSTHDASAYPPAYTLVQTQPYGWWYAARLPEHRAIIVLCTDKQVLKAHHNLEQPAYWYRIWQNTAWFAVECQRQFLQTLAAPQHLHIKSAPSAILSAVIGERWLAVGDAASSYDSMSSAGITKALLRAYLAGRAVAYYVVQAQIDSLHAYQTRVFADFNQYMQLHQQHYRAEQRYLTQGFWQRRQRAN